MMPTLPLVWPSPTVATLLLAAFPGDFGVWLVPLPFVSV
jgi:hypothetical protein